MTKLFTQIFDAGSKRRKIKNDYLLIEDNIVARTGIQKYTKRELGIADSSEQVSVYRSPEEVFADSSIATYEESPITVQHPKQFVDVSNHDKLSVGDLVQVKPCPDDGVVRADLIVKTSKGLKAINDGIQQISMGYTAEIIMQDGVTPDGEVYQAVVKNIKINHCALVNKGRAGIAQLNDSVIEIEDLHNQSTEENMNVEELLAALAKLSDAERESVIGSKATALTDEQIQQLVNAQAEIKAKQIADEMIKKTTELQDTISRAKILIKDYQPNAEADRRQVMLDVMNTAAGNQSVKKMLDAMFSGADPQTLSDSALFTGFNFITNMVRDLPYMVNDSAQFRDAAGLNLLQPKSTAAKTTNTVNVNDILGI